MSHKAIDMKLKYQAILFADVETVGPEPDAIIRFIEAFRDMNLVPSTFQELSPNGPAFTQRLQLSGATSGWLIQVATDRVIVQRSPTDEHGSNLGDVAEFCAAAIRSFSKILNMHNCLGNRVALVTEFLMAPMTDTEIAAVYEKLFRTWGFYENHVTSEWDWRSCARMPTAIGEADEALNVITTIKRVHGLLGSIGRSIDRVLVSFDINTVQECRTYRFGMSQIEKFYDNALNLHNSLQESFLEYLDD